MTLIAFAEDAAPFSFREGGQPAGDSVDLRQRARAVICRSREDQIPA